MLPSCCVRAPFKLALLNWMPLEKYWIKKKQNLRNLKNLLGQLFKPREANPRSYATKNGSAYRPHHKEKNLTHCCSLREQRVTRQLTKFSSSSKKRLQILLTQFIRWRGVGGKWKVNRMWRERQKRYTRELSKLSHEGQGFHFDWGGVA